MAENPFRKPAKAEFKETPPRQREELPREPAVGEPRKDEPPKKEVVRRGELYSANPTEVRLFHRDGQKGAEPLAVAEDCQVSVNGVETTPDDLRRGDEVVLRGDPIEAIEAAR